MKKDFNFEELLKKKAAGIEKRLHAYIKALPDPPAVLRDSMHGREHLGTEVAINLANWLVNNKNSQIIGPLLANRDIFIIPMHYAGDEINTGIETASGFKKTEYRKSHHRRAGGHYKRGKSRIRPQHGRYRAEARHQQAESAGNAAKYQQGLDARCHLFLLWRGSNFEKPAMSGLVRLFTL